MLKIEYEFYKWCKIKIALFKQNYHLKINNYVIKQYGSKTYAGVNAKST
jgi:hypothetical protein